MSEPATRLSAFVNFPSPYTQSLILQALTSLIPALSLTVAPPTTPDPTPQLQWADYDLLKLDDILASPKSLLISSYVYRKTLIRKHLLQAAIAEYIAKQQVRGQDLVLDKSIPKGTAIDIQFADELDELLADELYEVKDDLDANAELKQPWKRKWFLVKPGLSDKGQGIRMFSTEADLRGIMESFDPPSDDEEEEDDEDEEEEPHEGDHQGLAGRHDPKPAVESDPETADGQDGLLARFKQLASSDFPDDEDYVEPSNGVASDSDEDEDGDDETGVQLSQLRHFVIQEYVPRPMLLDPLSIGKGASPVKPSLHKFHLRAYVLLTGTYELYLSRTLLALFSDAEYSLPGSRLTAGGDEGEEEMLDLRPHLTNTCLQIEGANGPPEHLVHLFSELSGSPASIIDGIGDAEPNTPVSLGNLSQEWLEDTYQDVGKVIAEAVKAGVECGGFGMQLLPNAFEIFGVDLMLSFPEPSFATTHGVAPAPLVSLLEFNASPDFTQSGDRLRAELGAMFKGVIQIAIAPFFGIEVEDAEEGEWVVGRDRYGWTKIAQEQTRGEW